MSEKLDVKKEELFEKTPIPNAVAKLAIPTIAASIVMVIYNLADTFFVGLLNDPISTSAVTLAAPVLLAFNAVTNLFGVGCSSMMSRALGVKDYTTVKKTAVFGIYLGILSGLMFSLVATLFKSGLLNILGADATNLDKTAEYLFWTVTLGAIPSILNIILDPIFILPFGLNMGAAGAGCATFISNSVACIYFIILLIVKKNKTYVSVNPKLFVPTKEIVKNVFGVGIPASIQNILNVVGSTILNNLAASYGVEAVSAIGITHKIALVPLYFSMGGGQGIMPLIGYNYASNNRKRLKDTVIFAAKVFISMMFVAGILFYIFSNNLVSIFMKNNSIIEYGGGFLKGFALAIPFLSIDFMAVAIFQACGKGTLSLFFAVARKVLLEIPFMIILEKVFGMYGMAYGQLVAEFTLSIISIIVLYNMLKEKPNLDK